MKNLHINLRRAAHSFQQPAPWIMLLTLNLPSPHAPIRICSNNEDVTFDGYVYSAFPFKLDEIKENSKGEIPRIKLSVSNITQVLMPHLEEFSGGMGFTVQIVVVNADQISDLAGAGSWTEFYSDLMITFEVISTSLNREWVVFTLGAKNPLRNKFPKNRYIKNSCRFASDFKGIHCGYSGSDTTCDGSYASCEAKGNENRYGGFQGLNTNVRLV